jgi:nucleotide-binding universal stress UspA family protein
VQLTTSDTRIASAEGVDMSHARRVLYASDFSPASMAAFPHAITMAKATGAELIIMHVLASPIPIVSEAVYLDPETWDRIYAGAQAEAHKQLEPLVAGARAAGIQASGFIVDDAYVHPPADSIVRAAKEKEVDFLVLGTHGRTGVAKFFLGSVAARVVATAPCPVLTVRASERDSRPKDATASAPVEQR